MRFAKYNRVPRPKTFLTSEFPYHVTCRTNNKEWFALPLKQMWEIFSIYLKTVQKKYSARIISFVLMSNHFHLIIQTPQNNVDLIMQYLLREISKCVGKKTDRSNHAFGNRYKGCVIDRESYFFHTYKYVYRNPAEAKIVKFVEDYPYSTLHHVLNNEPLLFTCEDLNVFPCDLIPSRLDDRLSWLNNAYEKKELILIENGLRHSKFEFSKSSTYETIVKALHSPQKVYGTF